jgi:ring-1,2-phenylacetyl-CoA epoxidase subunit PaaD
VVDVTSDVVERAWSALETVTDPEIPVITLRELGILRDVQETDAGLQVIITPSYSGCPAMGQIEDDVRSALEQAGIPAQVVTRLAPAWTTDWLSDEAKEKLRAYGIAPPQRTRPDVSVLKFMRRPPANEPVACPQCGSTHTLVSSQFGSTACKALYKCLDCLEPFDYFKPH